MFGIEGIIFMLLMFIQGEDFVKKVEAQGSNSGTPAKKVTIVDSGELK
jgi:hypothetical protein